MAKSAPAIRIGIYGEDYPVGRERHGCGLWPAGIAASVTASEAVPVRSAISAGGPGTT